MTACQEAVEEDFIVWPENWDIVVAFLAVATQWNAVCMATMSSVRLHWLGLNYAAVRARFPAMSEATFQGLQIMEVAARAELNSANG
nr:DUF1799 domain-containing protein [Erythrobacter ramosus]